MNSLQVVQSSEILQSSEIKCLLVLWEPLLAPHCVRGHPKPNWILFCADEKVDLGLVELLSLNFSAHQALSYPNLLLKSWQECGVGRGYLHNG